MDFGWAINALKAGLKVTRQGWNGKGMFLWLMPATNVKAEWCKEPVLKKLAEDNGGEIPCLGTIRMYTHDSTGRHAVLTGWLASQSDMLGDDWVVYLGEGHDKQTPEEAAAYKKLMLDNMPGSPAFKQRMLDLDKAKMEADLHEHQAEANLDKLPKAGSMDNCDKLSRSINQLLDTVTCLPNLNAYVEPGPNDKELTITIREVEGPAADSVPVHVGCTFNITHHNIVGFHVSNPDAITKSSLGSDTLDDKVEV